MTALGDRYRYDACSLLVDQIARSLGVRDGHPCVSIPPQGRSSAAFSLYSDPSNRIEGGRDHEEE
jgi:hypothetical protein